MCKRRHGCAPEPGFDQLAVLQGGASQLGADAADPVEAAVGPARVFEVGLGEVGAVEAAVEEARSGRVGADEVRTAEPHLVVGAVRLQAAGEIGMRLGLRVGVRVGHRPSVPGPPAGSTNSRATRLPE